MILYYSTVTKEFYSTKDEAISAENSKIGMNRRKVRDLQDTLVQYYADLDAVRSKYDERLSGMIAQIFKDT